MAEHYCSEHGTVWFKKGKMKNYAHPVTDENGVQLKDGEGKNVWCNEPQEEVKPQAKSDDMSKKDWADKDQSTRVSIETQNAYTNAPNIVACLKANPQDMLAQAAYNYAMSKLGNWSSAGPGESPGSITHPEPPTAEQRKRLNKAFEGWGKKEAIAILIDRWHVNETKHLSKEQMEDYINQLEKQSPGTIPEDLPF